ncbi:MAG: hypothetical protein JO277_02505 [Candidatus Eremiobacteraeota bacterium]|nr:hypothetical protein [Candidatus Eremiobacteraeota bacterium]
MADRKHHHPLEGGSRISAYTFSPEELTLVTDAHDPLYDKRVGDPLKREFLLNIAARGVETAISVRRRGSENVVVRGKQRTKAVTVVNALACGVHYTGPVQAIHAAIREFGADADFVKKVTLFVKKPLKIRALPANAGDERDARLSMRAENAHRHGDAKADQIRFVQEEHEKYGTPVEEIALNEGVEVSTVKRWLKTDLSERAKPKKRGKASRPSAKQIGELIEQVRGNLTERELMLLDWARGTGRASAKSIAELFASKAA